MLQCLEVTIRLQFTLLIHTNVRKLAPRPKLQTSVSGKLSNLELFSTLKKLLRLGGVPT